MRICSIDTETLSKTNQLNKCIFHLGKEELLATSSVIFITKRGHVSGFSELATTRILINFNVNN